MADKFGRRAAVAPALLLAGSSAAACAAVGEHEAMLCAIVLWGLGNSLVSPGLNAFAADMAPSGTRAQALSLQRQAADTAFLVGPLGFGLMAEQTTHAAAMELSAVCTLGAAAVFWARSGTGGTGAVCARQAPQAPHDEQLAADRKN